MRDQALKEVPRSRPSRLSLILKVGAFALAALAGGIYASLQSFDSGDVRRLMSEQAAIALGRELRIDGDITMSMSPMPKMVAENVTLYNADWSRRAEMAVVKRLEMMLDTTALLDGRIQVTSLTLIEPSILLETNAAGEANWDFFGREDFAMKPDMTRDEAGRALKALQTALAARAEPPSPAVETAEEPAQRGFGIDRVVVRDATLSYVDGGSMRTVSMVLNHADGGIQVNGDTISLIGMKLKTGGAEFTGDLSIAMNGPRPRMTADLSTASLDLTHFTSVSAQPGKDGKVIPADRIATDWMGLADADLSLKVKRLPVGGAVLTNAKIKTTLDKGKLTVKSAHAGFAKGSIILSAVADARSRGPLKLAMDVRFKKVNGGEMFNQLGIVGFLKGGLTDAKVKFYSSGDSLRSVLSNMTGQVLLVAGEGRINRDVVNIQNADRAVATFHSINSIGNVMSSGTGREVGLIVGGAKFLAGVVRAADPFADQATETQLHCAVANVKIDKGVLISNKGVAIETDAKTLVGNGAVNFRAETLDLTVRSENDGLFGINIAPLVDPVRIGGTFANPDIGVNKDSIAMAVASIGAAFATGGISIMAETVVGLLMADGNPCQTAMDG